MMHKDTVPVNHEIFLWRDEHNLRHVSKGYWAGIYTLCGMSTDPLVYSGWKDAPTCLLCVVKP